MPKFKKGDRVRRTHCDCYPVLKGEVYTVENPQSSPGHLTVVSQQLGVTGFMEDRFELVEAATTSEQEQRKAAADRVWAAQREFQQAVHAGKALGLSIVQFGFRVQSIGYTETIKEDYEDGSVTP